MSKFHAPTRGEVSQRELKHQAISRKIGAEGMVLLENNGALPIRLAGEKIALFGSGVRHTVQGGTGSGEVNTRYQVNVEQGFEEAGAIIVSKAWLNRLDQADQEAMEAFAERLRRMAQERHQPVHALLWDNKYCPLEAVPVEEGDLSLCDTAIYVLARNSGEGADRHVAPGDYLLTDLEKDVLLRLKKGYKHLVVVLNVGGVVDTAFLREELHPDAVLLMSQVGNVSGLALADVISGVVTPCGHLTTTWAKRYEDYPCAEKFSYLSGDVTDEYYREGIYVGYRWFDAFGIEPAYPFGYGRSYTTFAMETEAAVIQERMDLRVKVTNTGRTYAGREVVQVYASAPEGTLEKPVQQLVAYAKTKVLAPGESQTLTIGFPLRQLASYDEARAAWVLEAGDYVIRVGEHSRLTRVVAVVRLDGEARTEQLQNVIPLDCDMEPISRKGATSYQPNQPEDMSAIPVLTLRAAEIATHTAAYSAAPQPLPPAKTQAKLTMDDVREGRCTLDDLTAQLTVEEMATLCVGIAREKGQSIVGAASTACPGAAGDTTSLLTPDRNIRNMVLADGPAGLRLCPEFIADAEGNVLEEKAAMHALEAALLGKRAEDKPMPQGAVTYYQYCTAIPIATLLAQTWDLDAIEAAGDLVGAEMEEMGATLWLAPGMNIHRNPLCGRNFEYYSEDPLVAGLCAAADTLGVQKHPGVGTTIKHFACNNLEDNRLFCNSHVTERALREIFLRGFEIAVKAAQPMSIMTSYNLLNGIHTPNRVDLVTQVARDEWGFAGCFMTDWCTTSPGHPNSKYPCSSPAGCIKAGNDLIMPGRQEDVDDIVASVGAKEGEVRTPITLGDLQACARRILSITAQSSAYEDAVPYGCPRLGIAGFVDVRSEENA